jgi:hypothetical protein
MTRFLVAAVLAALAVGTATADIAPPPPPKGKKYVNVTHEVKLGKDVKGYVFVAQTTTGPGRPNVTTSKLDLGEKATTVVSGGRRNSATLFAVPEVAAKEFKTEKELFDAVTGKKVKGVQTLSVYGSATVSDTVKGDSVTWTYTITGIDDKGMKTDVSGDGAEEQKPEKKEEKKLAFAEPGYLIGGLAVAVGIAFGGLWLIRRKK